MSKQSNQQSIKQNKGQEDVTEDCPVFCLIHILDSNCSYNKDYNKKYIEMHSYKQGDKDGCLIYIKVELVSSLILAIVKYILFKNILYYFIRTL